MKKMAPAMTYLAGAAFDLFAMDTTGYGRSNRPAYGRNASSTPPAKMPPDGIPMNTQSREEFYANEDRQVACPARYEPAVGDAVRCG